MNSEKRQKTKIFRYSDLNWKVILVEGKYDSSTMKIFRIPGPYCRDNECFGELSIAPSSLSGICPLCNKEYSFKVSVDDLKLLAYKAYDAELDKKLEFISLDNPTQPLTSEDEDERHWVRARFGFTSDGRKVVNVLIGDKKIGNKTHAFIDLDKEQLRFDWKDLKPNDVVARLVADFPDIKHIVERRNKNE